MATKYTKNVEWMRDYVDAAGDLVNLGKLRRVSGYQIPLDKLESGVASTHKFEDGTCHITIKLKEHQYLNLGGKKFKAVRQVSHDFAFVLDSLAHELAHLKHWEHTPQHLRLQAVLLKRFAGIAKAKGVKDTYGKY